MLTKIKSILLLNTSGYNLLNTIEELHSAHLNFWSEAKPTSGHILSSNSGRSLTATWTQALVTWDRHLVWHTKSQSKRHDLITLKINKIIYNKDMNFVFTEMVKTIILMSLRFFNFSCSWVKYAPLHLYQEWIMVQMLAQHRSHCNLILLKSFSCSCMWCPSTSRTVALGDPSPSRCSWILSLTSTSCLTSHRLSSDPSGQSLTKPLHLSSVSKSLSSFPSASAF